LHCAPQLADNPHIERSNEGNLLGDLITTLYVDERLPLRAVASQVGLFHETVRTRLMLTGVRLRPRGGESKPKLSATGEDRRRRRKYPELATLAVGESVRLPRSSRRLKWQTSFYMMAARIGIRVSVRRIDDGSALVIRIS